MQETGERDGERHSLGGFEEVSLEERKDHVVFN